MKRWQWPCATERVGFLSCPTSKPGSPRRTRQSDGLSVQWCPTLPQFLLMFGTTAIHDAFSLYGRPRAYSWDPGDQASMMYAYPVGPARDVSSHSPFSVLLSPTNYYLVTFHGTRNCREHGSPDRSHLRCSVPSFEHPLSSYTGPFVSERGPRASIHRFYDEILTPLSLAIRL